MPRVGLLLHVLESKLIFLTLAALIGKRMPARWIRWLSTAALQGVILGCLLTVFSYAMLPAWETCLVWLATRLSLQLLSMVVVVVVWQFGVLVLGKWAWGCMTEHLKVCLEIVGISIGWEERRRKRGKRGTGGKGRKEGKGEKREKREKQGDVQGRGRAVSRGVWTSGSEGESDAFTLYLEDEHSQSDEGWAAKRSKASAT